MALGQTHLDLGLSELSTAFTVRAEHSFVAAIQVALRAIAASPGCRGVAWKTAADAVFFLSRCSSFADSDSVGGVLSEVAALVAARASDRVSGIISPARVHDKSPPNGLRALAVAIAAYDYRLALGVSDAAGSGSAWFDLGISLHSWASQAAPRESQERAAKQARECVVEALRADPVNVAYWSALGNVAFATEPKTAQHAYIRVLEIDSKVSLRDSFWA